MIGCLRAEPNEVSPYQAILRELDIPLITSNNTDISHSNPVNMEKEALISIGNGGCLKISAPPVAYFIYPTGVYRFVGKMKTTKFVHYLTTVRKGGF